MGQAKKHRESIFRKTNGICIYCGGATRATTVDHMPPRSMFDRKDRPAGLEFPACENCNRGARLADLACALVGRIYPDNPDPAAADEFRSYLEAVKNNIPGLLEEMQPPAARAKLAMQRLGLDGGQGGLLRIGGPIALAHLEAFGARLGLAMHFQQTGQIVPPEGGVLVRIFSNVDLAEGKIPEDIFDILPKPATLAQGKKTVEDQFRYGVRGTEGGRMTMGFASFRLSFAVLAITTIDLELLSKELPEEAVPYRPGSLQKILPQNFSAGVTIRSR